MVVSTRPEACIGDDWTDAIVSKADAHADLFRFLMTGRSNEAVSEWLGAKLTGRVSCKLLLFHVSYS